MIALARVVATWFYCGYAPVAPGTAGSLAAVAIAWVLHQYWDWDAYAFGVLAVLLFLPAVWAADVTAKAIGKEDPGLVVVDEVVGQWLTIAGATHLNWRAWVLAFALFRILDIWKPSPVRDFERLHGGLGIVADDAMAGVYGAMIMFAAGYFNLY